MNWRWIYLGPLWDQIEREAEEERRLRRAWKEYKRNEYLDALAGRRKP